MLFFCGLQQSQVSDRYTVGQLDKTVVGEVEWQGLGLIGQKAVAQRLKADAKPSRAPATPPRAAASLTELESESESDSELQLHS